jgi:hypothetical protein
LKLNALIDKALHTVLFAESDDEGPILQAKHLPGKSKLVLVLGDNATGKSVFRNVITALGRKSDVEVMGLSMQGRTQIGIVRGMIYGDEGSDSTGRNSVSTVVTGIRTSQGRENEHALFWDEPDIGLSDNAAAGIGVRIGTFIEEAPEKLVGAFVVTHRRYLVEHLVAAKPHVIFTGPNPPASLDEWFDRRIWPQMPEDLMEANIKLYRRIHKKLQER